MVKVKIKTAKQSDSETLVVFVMGLLIGMVLGALVVSSFGPVIEPSVEDICVYTVQPLQ